MERKVLLYRAKECKILTFLLIHIGWKDSIEVKIDPPIQTEYFRFGGAMILIFIVGGANSVTSFCILSTIPGYMVLPPDKTMFAY